MNIQNEKLVVIVFTDIAGFTELASQNQKKASELIDFQRKKFFPIVKSYNGNWIKEIGDGLLLTFETIN